MKSFKYKLINLLLLLFLSATVIGQSIGSPGSTVTVLGKLKINKSDTLSDVPVFLLSVKNDTVVKYYLTDLLNETANEYLTPNYGLIGDPYNGSEPLAWLIDTALLRSLFSTVVIDSSSITYFVDSLIKDPFSAPDGHKYLIDSPGTGEFAGKEWQIATRVGSSWSYTVASSGDILVATDPLTAYYQYDGFRFNFTRFNPSVGGDYIGTIEDIGNRSNYSLNLITNDLRQFTIDSAGALYARFLIGEDTTTAFLKPIDPATGKIGIGHFSPDTHFDSLRNNSGVLEGRKNGVFVPQFTLPSGSGDQDLQSVTDVGNETTNPMVVRGDNTDDKYVAVANPASDYSAALELQQTTPSLSFIINGNSGKLLADSITGANKEWQLPNASGTLPISVSVNGGTHNTANVNGNIDIAVAANSSNATSLISGGRVAWLHDYVYNVAPASYTIDGVTYTSPSTDITLDSAHATLDRIDAFVLTTSGTAEAVTGTPSTPAVEPSIDAETQLQISFATVLAATTSPSDVVNNWIYQENTEWTTAASAGTVALASTSNPYAGTKDIEGTSVANGTTISFTSPGTLNMGLYQNLIFHIRSKANWSTTKHFTLRFYNGTTAIGNPVSFGSSSYGFVSTVTTQYQAIIIPLTDFGSISTATKFIITQTNSSGTIGWYLDNIQLQSTTGGGTPQTITLVQDVGGTGTNNISTTVTGIRNKTVPSLSAGFLKYSGTAWSFDNNTYVNTTDTAAMLSPYLRKIDTTGKWVTDIRRTSGSTTVEKKIGAAWTTAFTDSVGSGSGSSNVYAPLIKSGDTLSTRYNLLHYGADTAKRVYDVATTNTSTTVTSATASFTSNDIGKTILINGAGSGGNVLRTTISSVTNSTTIVVALAASATTSSDTTIYGKDCTPALQAAIAACANGGGGTVYAPVGTYLYPGALIAASNAQVTVPVNAGGATNNTKVFISIEGETVYGGSASSYSVSFPAAIQTRGTIFYSTISGSGYIPCFIGSADTVTRNRNDLSISNLGIMVYTNHGADTVSVTPINGRMFQKINAKNNTISPDIEVSRTKSPINKEVAGIIAGGLNDNGDNMITETEIVGFKYALVAGEHTIVNGNLFFGNLNGIAFPFSLHPVTGTTQIFACKNELLSPTGTIFGMASGRAPVDLIIESEFDTSASIIQPGAWYKSVLNVADSLGQLVGRIRINMVENAGIGSTILPHTYGVNAAQLSVSDFYNVPAFRDIYTIFTAKPTFRPATGDDGLRVSNGTDSASIGVAAIGGGIITTNDFYIDNFNSPNMIFFNAGTAAFKWGTGASLHMYLSSAGRLALGGITSPAMLLDVGGVNTSNSIARFGDWEFSTYVNGDSYFGTNIYFDGANYKLRAAGKSGLFSVHNGGLSWSSVPSGGAGATTVPVQRLWIDSTGIIGLGASQTNYTTTGAAVTIAAAGLATFNFAQFINPSATLRDGGWNQAVEIQANATNAFPALMFSGLSGSSKQGGIVWTRSTSGNTASSQQCNFFGWESTNTGIMDFKLNGNIGTTGTTTMMRIYGTTGIAIGGSGFTPSYMLDVSGQLRTTTGAYFSSTSGSVGIGSTTDVTSSKFTVTTTTQGAIPAPKMTTTQRTGISSPAEGLMVYDTDLHKLYVYDGTTWQAAW